MGSLRQTIMLRITLVLAGSMLTLSKPKGTYIVVKVPGESISLNPPITPSTPRTPEIQITPEEGTIPEIQTTAEYRGTTSEEIGTTPEEITTPDTSEILVTNELQEKSWLQEQRVEKGNLLTTLDSSPLQLSKFRVKFDLWIEKLGRGVVSVLHIGNTDSMRQPAFYIHEKLSQLQINFFRVRHMQHLAVEKWHTIDIERATAGLEAVYKIIIDEELKGNWTQSEPPVKDEEVKVYLSSPWRDPLNGKVRNLEMSFTPVQ